jgi:glycosyltransferase involved in cell wall biosynthesis
VPAKRGHDVPPAEPGVSVIICTHEPKRWADLAEAVRSVRAQTVPADEIVLVVDHQPALVHRLRAELPDVRVVANEGPRGASGARNTGAAHARGQWLAFLDDDAVAEPEWLARLAVAGDDPAVLGVGGRITPLWLRPRPAWFPDEFAWVVGASYRGLPTTAGAVRNVWTGSMLVSRQVFEAVGGFRAGFGKTGGRSAPEDTDFCLRAARAFPARHWRYEPAALVGHKVPAQRCTVRFFLRRCYAEGRGKVELARLLSGTEGMSSELRHAGTLPAAVLRELGAGWRGDPAAARRGVMIVAGLGAVAAGVVRGLCARPGTPSERVPDDSIGAAA